MATLIDWSQVETKVQSYSSLYECDTDSIALAHVAIEHLLGLNPDEIEESITDGSHDRGVDAVIVLTEGKREVVHLFQVKHVTTFEKAENNFPSSEIDKLLSFISDLLQKQSSMKGTCNPILWEKVQEIWQAFERGTPSFVVHLVGNMAPLVSTESERLARSLAHYRIFEVRQHTLESLAKALIESKAPKIDRALRLVDDQYFERIDGNIRGLVATVQCPDPIPGTTPIHRLPGTSTRSWAGNFPASDSPATLPSSTRRIRLCWRATGAPPSIAIRLSG